MPKMKYRWIHECPKPDMIVGERSFTTGHWIFKKTHTVTLYETRRVEWTCDCGAQWDWSSSLSGERGYWMCNYRPNVWKDYYEAK